VAEKPYPLVCPRCGEPCVPGQGLTRRWADGKLQPVSHVTCPNEEGLDEDDEEYWSTWLPK
jgi:hypothetical protein